MTEPQDHPEPTPSLLDRALRLFSDVHAGEGLGVVLMLATAFLILVSYYVLKTVREPLILATGGAEVKSYAAAGQAVLLMAFVPAYSWFTSRVDRLKVVLGVTAFFLVNVEMFWLGSRLRVPYLGIAFYVWVGIFSLAIIAQFWSYANDVYTQDAGERLFPVIAIGSSVGSWVGSKLAEVLFKSGFAAETLLHFSAGLLGLVLVLFAAANSVLARRRGSRAPQGRIGGTAGGFTLVLRNPYLRLVGVLLILLNVVNTTGEYILSRTVVDIAPAAVAAGVAPTIDAFIGGFYGNFFSWVNLLTTVLQAFVASRLVKYFGFGGVLFALPIVATGTYGLVAAGAGFSLLRWAKTAENATDYSIMNTARAMLWLPTSREEKYKAKQALDTFFVRAGDLLSAGVVFAGTTWLGLGVRGFATANLVVVTVWAAVAVLVWRTYRRLTAERAEAEAA